MSRTWTCNTRALAGHGRQRHAVGHPLGVHQVAIEARGCHLAQRRGDRPRRLIDTNGVGHRLAAGVRAIQQQRPAIGRPAGPSHFGSPSQHRDAPVRRAAVGRAQPHVVGLLAMRVERHPSAVRRPRHRLVLGVRVGDHLQRPVREPAIGVDDADLLGDVRILRIVEGPSPRAVGDREQRIARVPPRRFGLEAGELTRLPVAELGDERAVALRPEQHGAVLRHRGTVAVARERLTASRPASSGARPGAPVWGQQRRRAAGDGHDADVAPSL